MFAKLQNLCEEFKSNESGPIEPYYRHLLERLTGIKKTEY